MMDKENQERQNERSEGRVVNFRPVLVLALFLIFGIAVAYLQTVERRTVWWLVLLALALPLPFLFFCKRKLRTLVYLTLIYASFAVGMISFSFRISSYYDANFYDGEHTVVGTVVEVVPDGGGAKVLLDRITVNGVKERGTLTLTLADGCGISVWHCDRVQLTGELSTYSALKGNYGFRAEAIADRTLYKMNEFTSLEIVGSEFRPGAFLRGRITSTVYQCMGEESGSVTLAILLGNTKGVEEGLLENVRYGGVAHIFAVSGLHIGCVFAACLLLLRRNRIPAPARWTIVAAMLLLYGGVCGYSASVVRAIVTCLVTYGCSLLGMKYDALESLSLAAIVVLLLYPTLLFGVGMQLSFAACAGILLLSRHLNRAFTAAGIAVSDFVKYKICRHPRPRPADMFKANTKPKSLPRQAWESVASFAAASFGAQLGTLPILYVNFGYLSVASVGLNFLFVPLMSACFAFLLLFVLVACLLPTEWGAVLLYVPDTLLHAVMLPFHAVDFEKSAITFLSVGTEVIVCYYACLLLCTDKLNFEKRHKRLMASLLGLATVVCLIAGAVP